MQKKVLGGENQATTIHSLVSDLYLPGMPPLRKNATLGEYLKSTMPVSSFFQCSLLEIMRSSYCHYRQKRVAINQSINPLGMYRVWGKL